MGDTVHPGTLEVDVVRGNRYNSGHKKMIHHGENEVVVVKNADMVMVHMCLATTVVGISGGETKDPGASNP